eukprot:3060141-Amphidinium_carterae.5
MSHPCGFPLPNLTLNFGGAIPETLHLGVVTDLQFAKYVNSCLCLKSQDPKEKLQDLFLSSRFCSSQPLTPSPKPTQD